MFRGVGHEKRRGEQLKWSLVFRLYIGNFPCAQLPEPVHTARLGRVFFCVFSLGLCCVCSFVLFEFFVCLHSFMFPSCIISLTVFGASVTKIIVRQELVPSLLGCCKQKQRGLRSYYVAGHPLLNERCTSLLRAPSPSPK